MLQQQCNGNLHLFVKSKTFCRELIESLKQNNELVEEYIYNRQIHVVVIRPDINYSAFLEGEYTKIYTPQQLIKCFRPDSEALMVLKKDQRYFPKYYKFWKYPFMDKGFYVLIFYPQLDYIFSDRPDTYVCRGYGGEEIYIKKHGLKKEYDLVIDLSGKVLDHTKY